MLQALQFGSAATPSARAAHLEDRITYYDASAEPGPRFGRLEGTQRCEVCVIGGGYAGLSAALRLAQAGRDVILIERGRVGSGASGRNGGLVLPGFSAPADELLAACGPDRAARLWGLSVRAVKLVRALVAAHAIACDLRRGVVTAAAAGTHMRTLKQTAAIMRDRFGYRDVHMLDRAALEGMVATNAYHGGLYDDGAWHLHPLAYARGLAQAALAQGARLFESSPAIRVDRGAEPRVHTPHGMVQAEHVIVAANVDVGGLVPEVAQHVVKVATYMVATRPLAPALIRALNPADVAVYDTRTALDYYRFSADRRLVFGWGAALAVRTPHQIAATGRRRIARVFPRLGDVAVDYAWSGDLDLTLNRLTDIGQRDGRIWYAHGFSGHGVALATFTGRALADAIMGADEDYRLLAAVPCRAVRGPQWAAPLAGPIELGLTRLREACSRASALVL